MTYLLKESKSQNQQKGFHSRLLCIDPILVEKSKEINPNVKKLSGHMREGPWKSNEVQGSSKYLDY